QDADVAVRQTPYFRAAPRLPQIFDGLYRGEKIVLRFDNEQVFTGQEWLMGGEIQGIQAHRRRGAKTGADGSTKIQFIDCLLHPGDGGEKDSETGVSAGSLIKSVRRFVLGI